MCTSVLSLHKKFPDTRKPVFVGGRAGFLHKARRLISKKAQPPAFSGRLRCRCHKYVYALHRRLP